MYLDEFRPLVGQTLLADCNPAPVELVLTEARPVPNYAKLDRHPFILIFRTPPQIVLVAGAYALKCGDWGPALIHIEQIASPDLKDNGHFYQAIFN
jgi:hypothetical protein